MSARRNRKSFILALVILNGILLAVGAGIGFFGAPSRVAVVIFWFFFVPYFICSYFLTAQRLRDFGLTGWLALLWVVIGVLDDGVRAFATLAFALVLCSIPGTQGYNRYGPDPLERYSDNE
ncbi:DUF805 domain-containing protein [Pelagibacterium lentulum]|uniref:DUF805 domain-containing protein n=1 Tax=Pelagibacterium lentulum TaxID=2029865 RepID=UPI003D1171BA